MNEAPSLKIVASVAQSAHVSYNSVRAPENIFGYNSTTHKSHMLRVVHRGTMDDTTSWFQGRADFCQHGPLALAKEAFAGFFNNMPVGIHFSSHSKDPNYSTLLIPRQNAH
jgi:hypothetical protein